jgi:hypothetical protein
MLPKPKERERLERIAVSHARIKVWLWTAKALAFALVDCVFKLWEKKRQLGFSKTEAISGVWAAAVQREKGGS